MVTGRAAREAPSLGALQSLLDDPSHSSVQDEPVLEVGEIQGNILGGFMKDHQILLCLRIDEDPPKRFKNWLGSELPVIASSAEVVAFNRLFKAIQFGAASKSMPAAPLRDDVDRGLYFLAYQTSIKE